MSRKGMEPSAMVASSVNCMDWFMELMCSRNPLIHTVLISIKVSSTYLFTDLGGGVMC